MLTHVTINGTFLPSYGKMTCIQLLDDKGNENRLEDSLFIILT